MIDPASKRGELINRLEDALAVAEELEDWLTSYMIERALDEARAQMFRLPTGGLICPADEPLSLPARPATLVRC